MIRLWLSRGTAIPIKEQLSAQFVLGILSRRLAPGERLPSVRELARRLSLHPNTISAVYQDLVDRGWVSSRSGVFVRRLGMPEDNGSLEMFVRACMDEGLARGFSLKALRSSFGEMAHESRAQEFLVIDPDPELARILSAEMSQATGRVVPSAGCDEASQRLTPTTCVLVTEAFAPQIPQSLGRVSLRTIRLKSMQDVLVGHQRPTSPVLVAVASRSESVLRWAWTLLSALGFSADSVLLRKARCVGWQDGLTRCKYRSRGCGDSFGTFEICEPSHFPDRIG
jgi:DNA-binding transcriptional regulator YhcF (GntR family)